MKKLIFCFLISILIHLLFTQEFGWMDISENIPGDSFGHNLSDVYFIDDNEGWITCSSVEEIYHTTDGGETFEVQSVPIDGDLLSIHMLDNMNGYCGNSSGIVFVTEDGGENWNLLGFMGTLTDISFPFDTDPEDPVGYACGDGGNVWEITNTLTNLNSPSSSTFRGISAPSLNNVWVSGGSHIYYFNGDFFYDQSSPAGAFDDIHFINDNEGWVVGDSGVLGKTINGGDEWFTLTNPDPDSNTLYGVFFHDSDNGWAVGSNGLILYTENGGNSWLIDLDDFTNEDLVRVHFTSPDNGYIVGTNKTLLKYGDITSLENEELPADILLLQNYPNPFNPATVINYQISVNCYVSLSIYDIKGRLIKTFVDSIEKPGEFSVIWSGNDYNGNSVSSGIYFTRLTAGNKILTRRMVLLK